MTKNRGRKARNIAIKEKRAKAVALIAVREQRHAASAVREAAMAVSEPAALEARAFEGGYLAGLAEATEVAGKCRTIGDARKSLAKMVESYAENTGLVTV